MSEYNLMGMKWSVGPVCSTKSFFMFFCRVFSRRETSSAQSGSALG